MFVSLGTATMALALCFETKPTQKLRARSGLARKLRERFK